MTELPDGYLAVKSYLDSRMVRDDFWKRASDGLDKMLKRETEALALLNQHLKGRTYTDLDDALRNMLQAFISLRGLAVDDAPRDVQRCMHGKSQFEHCEQCVIDSEAKDVPEKAPELGTNLTKLLDRTAKYMTLAGIVALKDSMNPMEALLWDIRETQGKKE